MAEQDKNIKMFKEIYADKSDIRIWKKLPNGCYIGTMGYSKKNVIILEKLLKSFEEQYGEEIDINAAEEELKLYEKEGKLFIYFDKDMNPVSMNGCIYNHENKSVDFISTRELSTLYFYGLSTIPSFRGNGACRSLINFAIEFAKANDFDLVYARTDLVNSNSEWIMEQAGMTVCQYDGKIISEWVDVTEDKGDFRLYLWKPLKDKIAIMPKDGVFFSDSSTRKIDLDSNKEYKKH